jgi:hypothetical protein
VDQYNAIGAASTALLSSFSSDQRATHPFHLNVVNQLSTQYQHLILLGTN